MYSKSISVQVFDNLTELRDHFPINVKFGEILTKYENVKMYMDFLSLINFVKLI